jgi:phage repressor protein C with HTH and peptisase S24 domain
LSEGQKRKWIAVSANFAQFSEQDKTKLHSRMTDWASLSVKQREQARINFAQNKELTAKDKQAKWESYKALPPETKQALAKIDVAPKPTGAATAAKPVAKDKLVASSPKTDKSSVR